MIGALHDPYTDVALADDAVARADLDAALQGDEAARERMLNRARRVFGAEEQLDPARLVAWAMVAARVAGVAHDWDDVRAWLARIDQLPARAPGPNAVERVGVDPWIFRLAYADDTGWETSPVILVVTNQSEDAARALQDAGRVLSTTGEDGHSANPAYTGRYTPNYVSEPELTDDGVQLYVDTKGELPRPMGEAMVDIVRDALAGEGVTAWVTYPHDPETPLASDLIVGLPPAKITRTGWRDFDKRGQGDGWVLAGHSMRGVTVGSLEGRAIAVSACDTDLRVWDVRTGELCREIATGHWSDIGKPVLLEHAGSTWVACGSVDDTASVWDVGTGEQVGPRLRGHDGPVRACAAATLDDRPVLVTASTGESPLRLWDPECGSVVGTWDHSDGEGHAVRTAVVATLESRQVGVTVDDGGVIRSFDVPDGQLLHAPRRPPGGTIRALSLDPRRPVLYGGRDDGTVVGWDVGSPPPDPPPRPEGEELPAVRRILTTMLEGKTVFVALLSPRPGDGGRPGLHVWEPATRSLSHGWRFPGAVDVAACTVDGEMILVIGQHSGEFEADRVARVKRLTVPGSSGGSGGRPEVEPAVDPC